MIKKTELKRIIKECLMVITLISITSCSDNDLDSTVDPKQWTYDQNMDKSVTPGDNFYMYCNGTWYKNFDLNNNYYWGFCGYESQTYIDEYKKKMNSPILAKLDVDIANIDNTTEAAEQALIYAMAITENIQTHEDAWRAIAKAIKMGYTPFFTLKAYPESRMYKAFLDKGSIPTQNPDVEETENRLMELGINRSEAAKMVDRSVRVMNILRNYLPKLDLSRKYRDTHPEIQDKFKPFTSTMARGAEADILSVIFDELGINDTDASIIQDLSYVNYCEEIANLSPDDIKSIIDVTIARDNVFISNAAFEKVYKTSLNRDNFKILFKKQLIYIESYDYVTNVCTEDQKTEMIARCKEMIATYKKRVNDLDWMSATTKANAIKKLDNMIFNVGYPDKWITEGLKELTGTTLMEDVLQLRASCYNVIRACVGKASQEVSFSSLIIQESISLLEDNALYSPSDNSINILPIYMMKPYFSKEYSDAFNYSTLASTIGHEMTHSLDENGSRYDEAGKNRNWWTVADKMEFEERQKKLVNCVNLLEIMPDELPNEYADGQKTLGENTADLGGMKLAYQAYMEKLSQEGYFGDEKIKQEKKFFQAYAEQWRAKYTYSYATYLKNNDVHSLPKERVNAIVMNMNRWYELYNVKFGDKLYLTPEKRANIW